MGTKFKIDFKITEETIFTKFIDYKLNPSNTLDNDKIKIEKLDNGIFKKITTTSIDLPKPILDLVGFNILEIEEEITLNSTEYTSIIHSPIHVNNRLKFKETFRCYQEGKFLICILSIEGVNYLPTGLKSMAESIYSKKRKNRLIRELKIISGKNNKLSYCSDIQ